MTIRNLKSIFFDKTLLSTYFLFSAPRNVIVGYLKSGVSCSSFWASNYYIPRTHQTNNRCCVMLWTSLGQICKMALTLSYPMFSCPKWTYCQVTYLWKSRSIHTNQWIWSISKISNNGRKKGVDSSLDFNSLYFNICFITPNSSFTPVNLKFCNLCDTLSKRNQTNKGKYSCRPFAN
jgi:hypothetical protein